MCMLLDTTHANKLCTIQATHLQTITTATRLHAIAILVAGIITVLATRYKSV